MFTCPKCGTRTGRFFRLCGMCEQEWDIIQSTKVVNPDEEEDD